jgi:hypothetical protein
VRPRVLLPYKLEKSLPQFAQWGIRDPTTGKVLSIATCPSGLSSRERPSLTSVNPACNKDPFLG